MTLYNDNSVLCVGVTLDNKPCTRHRTPGSKTCRWHSAEAVEARAKALEAQAAKIRGTIELSAVTIEGIKAGAHVEGIDL